MSVWRGVLLAILLAFIPFLWVHGLSADSSYYTTIIVPTADFIHEYKDEITAGSTTVIAFFTVFLAISTIALWIATRRSANIAERALTELERAFIGIEI